jgi:hypothetical protein
MTQRIAARSPGRPKAADGAWRSRMTKRNWVSGLNAWLGRTAD